MTRSWRRTRTFTQRRHTLSDQVPSLGNIPIIGPLLFDQNIIVYLTYVLVFAVDVLLFRTRWGLRTRAVGEHPKAADTVGINVRRRGIGVHGLDHRSRIKRLFSGKSCG